MAEPVYTSSAFRHGYTQDDLQEMLQSRYIKVRSQRGLSDVYEIFGRNFGGDYLHAVYRLLPDGRWRVFHIARMTPAHRRRYRRIL